VLPHVLGLIHLHGSLIALFRICIGLASAWFSAASPRLGLVNADSASVSWKLPHPHHWCMCVCDCFVWYYGIYFYSFYSLGNTKSQTMQFLLVDTLTLQVIYSERLKKKHSVTNTQTSRLHINCETSTVNINIHCETYCIDGLNKLKFTWIYEVKY